MGKRLRPACLLYQREWVYDDSRIKICEKSRRIGITWCTAGEAVTVAGRRGSDGGMDVWYMVSSEDDARQFILDCVMWAGLFQSQCAEMNEVLIEDEDANGKLRMITAFEIRFASGKRIRSLSSNPRRLRGKQGWAIIDEAAHHPDLKAFMKAAIAFTMQGGRIAIISTHNGKDNEFNRMIESERNRIKKGERRRYSLHRYPLDRAIDDGFYQEIVCRRNLQAVRTPEAQAQWRQQVIDDYGDDADEELHAIPSGGKKVLWSTDLIEVTRWEGKIPELWRKIVSVDPSGSDEDEGNDDCGIIAMGITGDNHIYVTHDETTPEAPELWAQDAVNLYLGNDADTMVAEKNYGGKMVRDLIRLMERGREVEYKDVVSKTSKYSRAKPIAAIHKKLKIHLCGHFPELEEEMTTWCEGMPSPNRLDAFVQGCSELLWPDDDQEMRSEIFSM